jgi:hypothetical protein
MSLLVVLIAWPAVALAQSQGDGARVYWKGLVGMNVVNFWPIRATGNANPFDPAHVVTPDANFEGNIALAGYSHMLDLFGRAATASVLLPVGNLQGEITGALVTVQQSARGFGDPLLQFNTNLVGALAIKTLESFVRYEPKFTLDLLGSLALPIGEYDSDRTLNIGQNRWYGRIGAPMVLVLGPWVPGKRTTIEALPAVWFFGDNDDFGGQTLKTDPLLQLEGHLTRDLTETFWVSLDVSWFNGAKPEIDGVTSDEVNNLGVGLTVGFQVNDNLMLNASYFSTVNDSGSEDLKADEFRLMLTYLWHPLLEGVKRLKSH